MKQPEDMRKVVRSQTAARLKKLNAELRKVPHKHAASSDKDADAIHDLRVSIRRLSRELKVFRAWFDDGQEKPIRRRLRKLLDRCAAVRNCDIALEVLQEAGCRSPELAAGLEKERRRRRKELARTLASWRHRDRIREWRGQLRVRRQARDEDPHAAGQDSPMENAGRILPAMVADFFRAGRRAARLDSNHREMHQFRLKAKRMRYTLELFDPVFSNAGRGRRTTRIMESLKGLQERLGAVNDCATTLEMVSRDPGAAEAVRRLAAAREDEFRAYWSKHFDPGVRLEWMAALTGAAGKY